MRGDEDYLATNDQAGASRGDVPANVARLKLGPGIELNLKATNQPRSQGKNGTP